MRRARGFEHVSAPIARLKERIDQAITERDEPAAAEAHDDLVSVEHEQRVIQTVRKYSK